MKNVSEEYVRLFDGLDACRQGRCEDCSFEKVYDCLDGADGIFMKAMMLLEAMHDWLVVNHLWYDFVRDTEGPLDIMEYQHKYVEETHGDRDWQTAVTNGWNRRVQSEQRNDVG